MSETSWRSGSRFSGRAKGARPASIGGEPGAVWAPGGKPRIAFAFTIADALITAIDLLADPERLAEVQLVGKA